MDAAAVGARVRAARTARATSQRALARSIGVSPATLSQIETGRTGLSVVRLAAIAAALGMPVADMLEAGSTSMPAPAVRPGDWRDYPPLDVGPVLTAAVAEFLEYGYHGATVRGIAQRAGMSVAGIYHHQPSKQHLLRAVLDHAMAELIGKGEAALADGSGPVQRFRLLVEHLALFHTHRRELGFIGTSEMRSFEPGNRAHVVALRDRQQRMVDDEVLAAVAEGSFTTPHPRDAARAVVTMCTALPAWWRPGGPLTPEEVAVRYVRFAVDLMGGSGPTPAP